MHPYNQYHSANYLHTGHKDESQKHCVELKKPVIPVWFNFYRIQNQAQLLCGDRNQNKDCLGLNVQERLTAKKTQGKF